MITRNVQTIILAIACLNSVANAAVIRVKGEQEIGVIIVAKDGIDTIVDEISPNGKRSRRKIRTRDIEDIFYAVSPERLSELNPEKPQYYKEYAEELAAIELDPEARPMALRLYHIAAFLSPDKLAESCILGMIQITKSSSQKQHLRAVAFLHSKTADEGMLKETPGSSNAGPLYNGPAMLDLKALRARRKRSLSEDEIDALISLSPTLSKEQLVNAAETRCEHCTAGNYKCSVCEGRGYTGEGTRRQLCTCYRGKLPCSVCDTFFRYQPLPVETGRKLLALEVAMLKSKLKRPLPEKQMGKETWSQSVPLSKLHRIRPLSLRYLTENDPTKCVFSRNQWQQATGL